MSFSSSIDKQAMFLNLPPAPIYVRAKWQRVHRYFKEGSIARLHADNREYCTGFPRYIREVWTKHNLKNLHIKRPRMPVD